MKIYSRSTFKQGVPQFLDLGLIEVVSYLPAGPWRDLTDLIWVTMNDSGRVVCVEGRLPKGYETVSEPQV
jgi:hypothetical protein